MHELPFLVLRVVGISALAVRASFVASPPPPRYRGGGGVLSPFATPLRKKNNNRWQHGSSRPLVSLNLGGNKEDTSTVETTRQEDRIFSFFTANYFGKEETTSNTTRVDRVSDAINNVTTEISSTLSPFANVLDEATDGWALTYADLSPETESTPAGISFLLTNLAYGIAGFLLTFRGDPVFGLVTEVAGVFSFIYHFSQLKLGPDQAAVRVALMVDYIVAGAAILTTLYYLAATGLDRVPVDGLILGAMAVVSLSLSWVWEVGYPYLFFHSIWHLLSAYAGYVVGQAHLDTM